MVLSCIIQSGSRHFLILLLQKLQFSLKEATMSDTKLSVRPADLAAEAIGDTLDTPEFTAFLLSLPITIMNERKVAP